uniref:Slc22a-1 n=1 Tax=Schmidtea mediterranea TaxID=79327 RepID=A0A0H3YJ93_SCHMD|nr:slc22a-1 [Schmidtea mediterranea]
MILEDILKDYNKRNTFKFLAFFILSLPSFQFSSQMQNILISTYTPKYTCLYNSSFSKISISADQCNMIIDGSTIVCNKWNFSYEPVGRTMMSDFSLVCDYKNLGDIILIVWYSTSITGPIMGWFSDKFGRKKVAIFNLCLETISTFFVSFTPDVTSNIICRLLIGISANGFYTCYVWLMEMVDNEFREFSGSFIWTYGCLAYMVFPLTAYFTKDWRITQLISLIPNILYFLILLFPESPRWLCVTNRKSELIKSLNKIAEINKIDTNINYDQIFVPKTKDEHNTWKALKDKTFSLRMTLSFLLVFSINLIYAAIAVNLQILSNNMYISMFLLGLMEFPGILLSYVSLRFFRRKTSFILIGGIGSIFILISVFFSRNILWQGVIRIIFGCIAKIAVTTCNQSTMVYVSELCPTSHRSLGFASIQLANLCSFTAAVYINKLSTVLFFLPMVIYFILMFLTSCIIYLYLPETKNLPIPETLLDQKMLKVNKEKEFLDYMNKKREMEVESDLDLDLLKSNESTEESHLINRKH